MHAHRALLNLGIDFRLTEDQNTTYINITKILFTRSNRGAQIFPEGGVHAPRDHAAPGQEGHAPQVLQPEAGRDPHQEPAGLCAAPLGARGGQGRGAHQGTGPWLQGGERVP